MKRVVYASSTDSIDIDTHINSLAAYRRMATPEIKYARELNLYEKRKGLFKFNDIDYYIRKLSYFALPIDMLHLDLYETHEDYDIYRKKYQTWSADAVVYHDDIPWYRKEGE